MKKKIYTGILFLAVVIIWGYVGFQFINGMSAEEEELSLDELTDSSPTPIKLNTKQALKLNYQDPFLKSQIISQKKIVPTVNQQKPSSIKKTEAIPTIITTFNWPVITYKGLIQNQNRTNRVLGLIQIDGKECLVKPGEKINNLLITSIKKDKVEISADGQTKSFLRN